MKALNDGIVLSGPFKGLRRGHDSSWGGPITELLGAYEAELHESIEKAVGESYDRFINIGCAEGYYAVGFAVRSPLTQVVAFDIDEKAQELAGKMARQNGVSDRVAVRGVCTTDDLEDLLDGHVLILSDCEGYELELLDPEKCPSLRFTDMIVELHDFVEPSLTKILVSRFQSSHEIELIDVGPRDQADYPLLRSVSSAVAARALAEHRPVVPHPMQWAIFRSRSVLGRRSGFSVIG